MDGILEKLVGTIKAEIGYIENAKYEILMANYLERMYRRNSDHMFRIPGGDPFMAQIQGATESGLLILRKEDDSLAHFAFKEIQYL